MFSESHRDPEAESRVQVSGLPCQILLLALPALLVS